MRFPTAALCAFGLLVALPASGLAADGQAVYAARCASCHGADGKGDTPVGKAMKIPPLAGSDKSAADIVTKIREHVPAAKDMSDADIEAAATHAAGL